MSVDTAVESPHVVLRPVENCTACERPVVLDDDSPFASFCDAFGTWWHYGCIR